MATLAESFLADLEDLEDDEEVPVEARPDAGEAMDMEADDLEALNYDDLDTISKLVHTERYQHVLQKVDEGLLVTDVGSRRTGVLEDDPDYKLIVDCNSLSVDIDNEIVVVHNFLRDKYRSKFPELESLVLHPIDYARVVKAIGNEMDMTAVNLDGVLPSATIMVVSVTGSTTNGQPLPEETLTKALEAADRGLALDDAKRRLLRFVESRMERIAPNLSAVVGTGPAANLMGTAGGLSSLSKMPSCNIQVLGAKRKTLAGFSSAAAVRAGELHAGFVFYCDIVQQTPPAYRVRASKLVAGKCTLMARVDAFGEDPAGEAGQAMKKEIQAKIEKWQEPPTAKTVKPLPAPDFEPKKKRGGRRQRAMKEKYGVTEMRKAANRVNFNIPEEEIGMSGEGMGLLGNSGASGRLRMAAGNSKKLQKDASKIVAKKYGSSGATNGLSSSLAFTPVQGIELVNPNQLGQTLGTGSGTDSVFSEFRGFAKVQRQLRQ